MSAYCARQCSQGFIYQGVCFATTMGFSPCESDSLGMYWSKLAQNSHWPSSTSKPQEQATAFSKWSITNEMRNRTSFFSSSSLPLSLLPNALILKSFIFSKVVFKYLGMCVMTVQGWKRSFFSYSRPVPIKIKISQN